VETFFSELTRHSLQRGAFTSVKDLEAAIYDDIQEHNDDPSRSSGPPILTGSSPA
jgi:hypothetical protein